MEIIFSLCVLVQNVQPSLASVTTVGTRFILYFTESSQHNQFPPKPVQLYVSTSSDKEVTVQVSAPAWTGLPKVNETTKVTAMTPKILTLPSELRSTDLGSENKGVLVEASAPVSVFAMNPSKNQAALCSVLSETSLGMEYIFPSFTFNQQSQGYIGIVAHQDQTWVEVTLPSSTQETIATFKGQPYSPETVIRVTLNKFQVTEIRQQPTCATCDLSGAKIKTNKSVAVFSIISLSNTIKVKDGGDLLVEQIVPVAFWGRTFVSHASNTGDLIRIMAGEPNITLYYSDLTTDTLEKPGDYVNKHLLDGQFVMCQATGRIQVMQYTLSPPFMLLVTPLEHYGQSAQVPTVIIETGSLQASSIKLLTRTCHTSSITVNSTEFPPRLWERLGTTGFYYASMDVPISKSGFHTIEARSETGNFGGYVYGKGDVTAYSAPLVIDGLRPVESFHWASPDVIALYNANKENKNRIVQQSWKLQDKDVLSTQTPISQVNVFSTSVCFTMCLRERTCMYASVHRDTSRNIICRLYDENMPCLPKTPAPGVRTYVSRIPLLEPTRNLEVFSGGSKLVDQI